MAKTEWLRDGEAELFRLNPAQVSSRVDALAAMVVRAAGGQWIDIHETFDLQGVLAIVDGLDFARVAEPLSAALRRWPVSKSSATHPRLRARLCMGDPSFPDCAAVKPAEPKPVSSPLFRHD